MKRITSLLLLLVFATFGVFSAEHFVLNYQNYSAGIFYLAENFPGDAVFVRINLDINDKAFIKSISPRRRNEDFRAEGFLTFYKKNRDGHEDKKINSTQMYMIENYGTKKTHRVSLLAGLPLSTWLKSGEYYAVAEFEAFGEQPEKITLPVRINEKDFISETIPLNAKNTAIRTNDSQERANQIKKLNEVLAAKDFEAVYAKECFQQPNPATRRTSFFGDRRVFAYSDGKSSTSLHYGTDFGVPTGNEVRACAGGKVVMAEERITTGWTVVLEHLPGLYSLYYHNSELKVQCGDHMKKGDLIAISGATGLATGPHIHWEMRLNMEAVNPDFFKTDFTFSEEK